MNFRELTNDVAVRLNEEPLTSVNFNGATGSYAALKEAINSSVRHINQHSFQYPFNHSEQEDDLIAGETRYSIPDNSKSVDFSTFRVVRNTALDVNKSKYLKQISYEEYLSNHVDQEDETDISLGGIPDYVVRHPSGEYLVVPMPDKAYTIRFDLFLSPVDMENETDTPGNIPSTFRYVIVDGAMYYAYMFRDNLELAQVALQKFETSLKQMRVLLVNENIYFRAK